MSKDDSSTKTGMATASFVLGIISIALSFIPIINNVVFVTAIIAIILGLVSLIKKQKIAFSIIALILGVASIFCTISIQKSISDSIDEIVDETNSSLNDMDGTNTEEILGRDVEVTLGEFEVEEGEYITETSLSIKVTNKLSEKASFNITIEAVDENGDRIDEGYVYANDLGAGQSQTFDIFEYVEEDKLEDMKNATFKIASVSKY